jgi:hypothetical protein
MGREWAIDVIVDFLRDAYSDNTMSSRVEYLYTAGLSYCEGTAYCARLTARLASIESVEVLETLAPYLSACPSPRAFEVFNHPEMPTSAIIEYYEQLSWSYEHVRRPPHQNLADGVFSVWTSEKSYSARTAARALQHVPEPDALRIVLALEPKLSEPSYLELAVIALEDSTLGEAKKLVERACASARLEDSGYCNPERYEIDRTLREKLGFDRRGAVGFLEKHPDMREEVLRTSEDCIVDERLNNFQKDECLRWMAALDYEAARRLARQITASRGPLSITLATLERFESPEALVEQMKAWGFLDEAAALPPGELKHAVTLEGMLDAFGRVDQFDMETGTYPNPHDELLARLTYMAGPPLSRARFDQLAPEELGENVETYLLIVHAEDKLYAAAAENSHDDWYDPVSVVGMLNTVARDLEMEQRFVFLPSYGQNARVAVAPGAAWRKAVEAGLLNGSFGGVHPPSERSEQLIRDYLRAYHRE